VRKLAYLNRKACIKATGFAGSGVWFFIKKAPGITDQQGGNSNPLYFMFTELLSVFLMSNSL